VSTTGLTNAIDAAQTHYFEVGSGIEAQFAVLDRLFEALREQAAHGDFGLPAVLKQAFDLAYELTGECEQLEPIAKLVGYEESESDHGGEYRLTPEGAAALGAGPVTAGQVAEVTSKDLAAQERIASALERIAAVLERREVRP
jgi:hypothetical protein